MTTEKVTIYEPNKYLKLGLKIWPQMVHELCDSYDLVWRLFLRNFSSKYKQTLLGYIWALIMPFIAIGTFVLLNRSGIVNIEKTDLPYPLFALLGLAVWQLFATGIVAGANSIVAAGSLISKINFPREALVFSSMAQSVFEFFIKVLLIIVLFVYYQVVPHWQAVFVPLTLLPILFLTLGLSLILSLLNGILRDTANVVSLLTTFLMFLTPVLYPISERNFFLQMNPLAPLINAPRDLIVYGYIKQPVYFFVISVLCVLCFLIAWRIFHITETKIPERI